ncbi:MAG TPA: SDR family NAD(P)-dependent oxidoreductase [Gemmataceae bacterium]|nr:SDR family NAD(P)-dependent oxidoreductase [Gemmataceae bacterium]
MATNSGSVAPGSPFRPTRCARRRGPRTGPPENVPVYEFAPLEAISAEHFHKQFDLNVLGLLLTTQEAVNHFSPSGGSIVNISSRSQEGVPCVQFSERDSAGRKCWSFGRSRSPNRKTVMQ